ncbi:MAG: hypothetical protein WA192_01765 [Candidatus Acidiferrales bacterium]
MLIYTDEGFVIASDSRGSGGGNSERKLFPTHGLRGTGVYAVSGAASFPDCGPVDPFIDIYKQTARKLESETFSDLTGYANRFSDFVGDELHRYLRDWRRQREEEQVQISKGLKQEQNVVIHFACYFNDKPSMSKRKIYYGGEGERPRGAQQEANIVEPYSGQHCYVGSENVLKSLLRGSPALEKFYAPAFEKLNNGESVSMEEAKKIAENYIEACKSEEGRKIDSSIGESIGGQVAIAVVKPPAGGFEWFKEPPSFWDRV